MIEEQEQDRMGKKKEGEKKQEQDLNEREESLNTLKCLDIWMRDLEDCGKLWDRRESLNHQVSFNPYNSAPSAILTRPRNVGNKYPARNSQLLLQVWVVCVVVLTTLAVVPSMWFLGQKRDPQAGGAQMRSSYQRQQTEKSLRSIKEDLQWVEAALKCKKRALRDKEKAFKEREKDFDDKEVALFDKRVTLWKERSYLWDRRAPSPIKEQNSGKRGMPHGIRRMPCATGKRL